jgi:hypothetical protein
MRVIDDAPGERRERRRRQRRAKGEERDECERQPAQNFTFGATSEPAVAENSAIGLLLE